MPEFSPDLVTHLEDHRARHGKPCDVQGYALVVVDLSAVDSGEPYSVWEGPCFGFRVLRGDFPSGLIVTGKMRQTGAIGDIPGLRLVRGTSLVLGYIDGWAPIDKIQLRHPAGADGTAVIAVLLVPGDITQGGLDQPPSLGTITDRGRVLVANVAADVLPAASDRQYAAIQVDPTSASWCWLRFGADATKTSGIPLGPGDTYEMSRQKGNLTTGRVSIISAGTPRVFAFDATES